MNYFVMFILKKLTLLIILFKITTWSDIDSCYYAEDFGDVGNRSTFSIAAQSAACNYNSTLPVSNPIQSVNLVKCLGDTNVSSANTDCSSNEECEKV